MRFVCAHDFHIIPRLVNQFVFKSKRKKNGLKQNHKCGLFMNARSPSEYTAAPDDDLIKYSLFTQFLKQSGMLPMIARLISLAAISRNSVVAASL